MLVVIESPYAGDVERNKAYLQRCIQDCLARGEAPFASHQMYTEALDDCSPIQRVWGIEAGFQLGLKADKIAFYIDYGMSPGMVKALHFYGARCKQIEVREIGENPPEEEKEDVEE